MAYNPKIKSVLSLSIFNWTYGNFHVGRCSIYFDCNIHIFIIRVLDINQQNCFTVLHIDIEVRLKIFIIMIW